MSKRTWIVVSGAVLALTAGVGAVAWRAWIPEPRQVYCREPPDAGGPLGGGELMTPERAEEAFNPPFVRPQIDVASDETISELWVRGGGGGEIYVVYRAKMIVIVRPWLRKTWQLARDLTADGSPGELISVRGIDVFTVPPQGPCFGGNAVFNLGGAHVAVINDGDLPFDDVRRVTESIIDTAPSAIAADAVLDEG